MNVTIKRDTGQPEANDSNPDKNPEVTNNMRPIGPDSSSPENTELQVVAIAKTPGPATPAAPFSYPTIPYLTGPRLWLVKYALLLMQFLVAMESSIVGISIESVVKALGSAERAQFVFTTYLVCYASFILLIGKLSDIFGRRTTFLASTFIFTIFSIACGASQTMVRLIIIRSFQGLGASGIQAISIIIIPDLIPIPELLNYSSVVSITLIGGLLIGLFLGGWIGNEGAWRWIFYVKQVNTLEGNEFSPSCLICWQCMMTNCSDSGPCRLTALVATLTLPWNHPPRLGDRVTNAKSILNGLVCADCVGCLLFVLGSIPLLFALIEAEVLEPWKSTSIILCLSISALAWFALVIHQWWLNRNKKTSIKPLIPVELFRKRLSASLLMSSFWFGFPYYGIMLMLPKRFQLVNSSPPMNSALRTLPMIALVPVANISVNIALAKTKLSPFYVLVACTAVQIVSVSILATVPESFPARFYVVLAIIGSGRLQEIS